MEPQRLLLAVVLTVVFFGGAPLFWWLSRRYRKPGKRADPADDLAMIYAGLFLIFGLLAVPYAFYDARATYLERECWKAKAYSDC